MILEPGLGHFTRLVNVAQVDHNRRVQQALHPVQIEVMGDLHRREGTHWVPTYTRTETTLEVEGVPVRVPWLEEETLAYVRRSRLDRAAICLPHCNHDRLTKLLRGEQATFVL